MYFLGDVHNQFEELSNLITESDIHNDTIFQVGDFGIGILDNWKKNNQLLELNEALIQKDVRMVVIRGNHDNPKRFDGLHWPIPKKSLATYRWVGASIFFEEGIEVTRIFKT